MAAAVSPAMAVAPVAEFSRAEPELPLVAVREQSVEPEVAESELALTPIARALGAEPVVERERLLESAAVRAAVAVRERLPVAQEQAQAAVRVAATADWHWAGY
jgi:hypothetical protein